MLPPAAAALAPDAILLRELLAVSLTGIIFYSPVHAPTGSGDIIDFAFEYLNPAAQRMMSMPEVPTLTHNQQWPHSIAHGTFQFHVDAFVTGEPREYNVNYQADGYNNYYRLAARRAGAGLLVSFTNPADQPRSPVEVALRESQPLRREDGQITGVTVVATEVTEQVRARQQLEQLKQELEARVQQRTEELSTQQNQLQQILGEVPAAIALLTGPEHHHTFFNATYQTLAGGRARPGLAVAATYPEVAEQGFIDLLNEVYTTGEAFRGTEWPTQLLSSTTSQPELHYLDFIYRALPDAQGQSQSILVFAVDVTEKVLARQQTEALQADLLAAARRQAQERETFRNVFEQTPALIALLRAPEHRFEYVNPAYQALFPGRLLLGLGMAAAVPEAQEQGFVATLDRVYQTGETFFGEELPFAPTPVEGQPLCTQYFNFTYQAYREGGLIAGISLFAFDVTEQVLARQQRAAREQQLRDLFEQAPVAIGILRGADYVVEVANPLVARLWGRTPAELLGRPVFEALPEARDQGFKELLDEVRQSGEAFVAEGVPAQLLRGDTTQTVYLNYVYQPLRDADGTVTSVAAVGTDVTAQVRDRQRVQELNDQLAAINGQLEASNAELATSNTQLTRTNVDLDNFIYTASHDLKAPISNIEGLLYLLQEELPTAVVQDQTVGPTLTRMLDAVERFKRTIDHLTEVSKLQKEHTPAADSVNLAAVVEDVRQDLLPLLQETGTRLVVDIAATPPIHFAAKNLRSIVYNLLSNAVKYRSPDRAPHVDVRAHIRAGHTVLEVHDNGLGLAPAQLPKLFGMFQRFHDHVDGTGIGLYMVRRMVENAGGRIDVHSQLGVGTTFFVYLPHTANLGAQPFLPFLPS
ncbi:hypothetical protein GCM10011495_22270 [Hymenobacter frigidus]|uniref:histidine kinase n=1 Tax=Hymenobacter frigidus TaxID=1524095 RepID=A0ABQ2A511_9BACT|nr:PAS domain-containing protein [Hymenobacter frigidus]GGH86215.1 hypothetical protein GCM10011495_22270 [Hymenobacter frigidus]